MNDNGLIENTVVLIGGLVFVGFIIYLAFPFYNTGRDARGKKSILRGFFSTFVYGAYSIGWFYLIFNFPRITDNIFLNGLIMIPVSFILIIPILVLFNYLEGPKKRDNP